MVVVDGLLTSATWDAKCLHSNVPAVVTRSTPTVEDTRESK